MRDSDKIKIKVSMQYCHLPKSRNFNDVSNPISLGMKPVKELEAVLYMVSKIGEEDLFSIGLEMRDSDRIRIKVSMQYCHLPKSRNSNDVSSPISLGMEPVKELEAVLYMVSKIGENSINNENFISKDKESCAIYSLFITYIN